MGVITPISPFTFNPLFEETLFQKAIPDVLAPLEMPGFDLPTLSPLQPTEDTFVSHLPKVQVENQDRQILVKVSMPESIDPKGLSVEVQDNTLTIQAKNRHEDETRRNGYYRKSFSQQNFSRSVQLSAEVDAKRAQARLEGKTLLVSIPKVSQPQGQAIPVQVSTPVFNLQ